MRSPSLACLCGRIRSTLDARCAFVAADFIHDEDEAADVRLDAYQFAFQVGMSAVDRDEEMPALFMGVPGLEDAWTEGGDFQTRCDEMAGCPDCQECAVCPWHG